MSQKDDWSELKLEGSIKTLTVTSFMAVGKFGKIQKGAIGKPNIGNL